MNIDAFTALVADLDNQTYDWQPNDVLSQDDVRELLDYARAFRALREKIASVRESVLAL